MNPELGSSLQNSEYCQGLTGMRGAVMITPMIHLGLSMPCEERDGSCNC